jgi:hypothetical protein
MHCHVYFISVSLLFLPLGIASNDTTTDEMKKWPYPNHAFGRTKKTIKYLSQESWCPSQDSIQECPE